MWRLRTKSGASRTPLDVASGRIYFLRVCCGGPPEQKPSLSRPFARGFFPKDSRLVCRRLIFALIERERKRSVLEGSDRIGREAMGRVTHGLIARSLLRRNLAPPPFSCAAAVAQRTVPIASSCGTASDVATCPRPRWRLFSLPVAPSRSVSVGLAGALSFSLTLVTAAEAKEPPSPELIPKDVVLYQYEACPFCNKVKG